LVRPALRPSICCSKVCAKTRLSSAPPYSKIGPQNRFGKKSKRRQPDEKFSTSIDLPLSTESNDADGRKLGETMAMDVPRIGREIVLTGVRGRVKEVSYEYESAGRAGRFTPEKIVIRV
jgi:hypothetical protein